MATEIELVKRLREFASIPEHCENVADCDECSKEEICLSFTNKRIIEVATQAADTIEKLSKPRWIPVTERLPEEAGKCLVCGRWIGKQTEIWVCEFMTLGCLKGWANNAANPSVSHWMPLPEPPKEE